VTPGAGLRPPDPRHALSPRAENERAFKLGNQRLKTVIGETATNRPVPFIGECTDDTCVDRVDLTLDEYLRVRSREDCFVIFSGHPKLSAEVVVEDVARYQTVRK
jgi:hypothetical protein